MRRTRRGAEGLRAAIDARAAAEDMTLTSGQRRAADALSSVGASGPPGDLYLVGPPGQGKTQVVDWFVAVSQARVLRTHLHGFFADLHRSIDDNGGWTRGVDAVLSANGSPYDVVCLDEFAVHDPADGVFLDRVLTTLADRRVRVIVTSNRRPHEQMPNPMFHAGFAPTMARVAARFTIVDVDGGRDLRQAGEGAGGGFASGRWIVGESAPSAEVGDRPGLLQPGSHPVRVIAAGSGRLRVEFSELCDAPTNAADLLWLADRYPEWTIVDARIPRRTEPLARWATLLDVTHDAGTVVTVWSPEPRAAMVDALTAAVPDAARAVSRMGAWTEQISRVRSRGA